MPYTATSSAGALDAAAHPLPTFRHDHVALRVADFDTTVAWYVERLGFTPTQQWPSGDLQLAYLERGDVKLEILAGAAPVLGQPATDLGATFGAEGLHHVCLAVDDLAATIDALAARGVPTLGEPFTVADIGRDLAFIQDPSGNLIELSSPSR